MVEFKRLEAVVEEMVQAFDKLDTSVDASVRAKRIVEWVQQLETDVDPKISRFVVRANEPDPEKRIYGTSMTTKILALAERAGSLREKLQAALPLAQAALVEAEKQSAHSAAEAAAAQNKLAAERAEAARVEALRAAAALKAAEEEKETVKRAALEQLKRQEELRLAAKAEQAKREAAEAAALVAAANQPHPTPARAAAATGAGTAPAPVATKAVSAAVAAPAPAAVTAAPREPVWPATGIVNHVESLAALDKALTTTADKVVIVDFMAPWCRPCVAFAPTFERIAKETPDAVFLKVDCDAVEGTTERFAIRAFPTFTLFFRGTVQKSFTGAREDVLRNAIAESAAVVEEILLAEAIASSEETAVTAPPPAAAAAAVSASAAVSAPHPSTPSKATQTEAAWQAAETDMIRAALQLR